MKLAAMVGIISFSSPYPSTSPSIIFFLIFVSAQDGMFVLLFLSLIDAGFAGIVSRSLFMLAPYVPEIASNPSSVFQIAILS